MDIMYHQWFQIWLPISVTREAFQKGKFEGIVSHQLSQIRLVQLPCCHASGTLCSKYSGAPLVEMRRKAGGGRAPETGKEQEAMVVNEDTRQQWQWKQVGVRWMISSLVDQDLAQL